MPRYLRKWYLLYRLHLKKQKAVAMPHEMTGVKGVGDGNFIFFGKHYFLKELAQKHFFLIPRSVQSQRKQMDRDDSILEECINDIPAKIAQRTAEEVGLWKEEWKENMGEIRANSPLIRITGHGEEFSSITNFFFVHLPGKYKWLGTGFVTLCAFLWIYFLVPHLDWACQIFSNIHLCN